MKKNNILIFGPFGDFGGRDVEVNIIARALLDQYKVDIVSSEYMTSGSFAIKDIAYKVSYTTLDEILFDNSILIRILALLNACKHGFKNKNYGYVSNQFSKKYLDYHSKRKQVLYDLLKTYDLVILPVQLSTQFLKETILFCSDNNIKIVIRTTGTVFNVSKNINSLLKKVDLFIHHSKSNSDNVTKYLRHNYKIIDQCTLKEKDLLQLNINKQHPLRYGYLGRLSEEKQILQISQLFADIDVPLVIAGDGPQKEKVLSIAKNSKNVKYLGLIDSHAIDDFFNEIDVLIIASKEETGPLVGVEAMAAGKLIVSTKVGAMPERLESIKESFWFDIEDVKTLLPIIDQLNQTSVKDMEVIALKNREIYLDKYSQHNIFNAYLSAIKNCIKH